MACVRTRNSQLSLIGQSDATVNHPTTVSILFNLMSCFFSFSLSLSFAFFSAPRGSETHLHVVQATATKTEKTQKIYVCTMCSLFHDTRGCSTEIADNLEAPFAFSLFPLFHTVIGYFSLGLNIYAYRPIERQVLNSLRKTPLFKKNK